MPPVEPTDTTLVDGTGDPQSSVADGRLGVPAGRYEIRGRVASGGGGRILAAHDRELEREIAIKELHDGADAPTQARFLREALLTAGLQHPNIVPVYEASRWPSGDPYYAMKLVDGRPLSQVIDEAADLAGRLALLPHVLDCTEAVAFAHAQGVIHRDLKPANVLVGKFGETVVIDWGLAQRIDEPSPVANERGPEVASAVVGTPAYMAPEQAAGRPVDPRADVYSLGALLYHLLAGRPPYGPGRPTELLGQVLLGPPVPLGDVVSAVPHELLAIVDKAMDRQPSARYPDAGALADDLRNFQTGRIVGAHRYSARQRLARFLRRHRVAVAAVAAAGFVLVGVGSFAVAQIVEERNLARVAEAGAELSRDEARTAQRAAEASRDQAENRANELRFEQARHAAERNPGLAIRRLAELGPRFDRWGAAQIIAENARAHGLPRYLQDCGDGSSKCTPAALRRVDFDAAAQRILGVAEDGSVLLFDPKSDPASDVGSARSVARIRLPSRALDAALFPDGERAVVAEVDGSLTIVDLDSGEGRPLGRLDAAVREVVVGAAGRTILTMDESDTLTAWDAESGAALAIPCVRPSVLSIAPMSLSGDREHVAFLSTADGVTVMDLATRQRRSVTGDVRGHLLAIDRRGTRVAIADTDERVTVWSPETGALIDLAGAAPRRGILALSPDGRALVVGGYDGSVKLVDLATKDVRLLDNHDGMVLDLEFFDDGARLLSASGDGELRIIELAGSERFSVASQGSRAADVRVGDDGLVAMRNEGGQTWLWSARARGDRVVVRENTGLNGAVVGRGGALWVSTKGGEVLEVDLDRGTRRRLRVGDRSVLRVVAGTQGIAASDADGSVVVFDHEGGVRFREPRTGSVVRDLAFSPVDDALVIARDDDLWLTRVALDTGTVSRHPLTEHAISSLAYLADGRMVISAYDPSVALVAGDGTRQHVWREHTDEVWRVVASADGRTFVSVGREPRLVVYDTESLAAVVHPLAVGVFEARFIDDDRRLVLRCRDLSIQVFDLERGEVVGTYLGSNSYVDAFDAGNDGLRIAAGAVDGTVRLWDRASAEHRTLRGHSAGINAVFRMPTRGEVVSVSYDGTLRAWRDALPADEAGLRRWLVAADAESP